MSDSGDAPSPYRVESGGLRLAVRLTPRASRDRVGGVSFDADGRALLQVRVAAPAVDGAANAALIACLAKALDVRKSDIRIMAGETSRKKRLIVSGDGDRIAARLDAAIAGTG